MTDGIHIGLAGLLFFCFCHMFGFYFGGVSRSLPVRVHVMIGYAFFCVTVIEHIFLDLHSIL